MAPKRPSGFEAPQSLSLRRQDSQSRGPEAKSSNAKPWVDPDDAPILTREWFENAEWRIGDTIIRRGRPPTGLPAKQPISLRLEPELIKRLRALGPGWQAKAAEALQELVTKENAERAEKLS